MAGRICANPACPAPALLSGGPRCGACDSYRKAHDHERPRRLILWPRAGHPLLRTTQLAKLIRCTYRNLDYGHRSGRITATIEADGSGTSRGYDLDAAVAVAVAFAIPREVTPPAPEALLDLDEFTVARGRWARIVVDIAAIRLHLQANWPDDCQLYLDDDTTRLVAA